MSNAVPGSLRLAGSSPPRSNPALFILAAVVLLGTACSSPYESNYAHVAPPQGAPALGGGPAWATTPAPEDDLSGIEALACFTGESGCAAEGPYLEGTCCAPGDNLAHLATATAAEAVDIEFDGEHVYACGGFGVRISDVTVPESPRFLGNATSRCQRIGVGPRLPDDTQIFWLAHHGDSWVDEPFLQTWHLRADDSIVFVHSISEPTVNFEGLLFHDGFLYAATHTEGVRIYGVAEDGTPVLSNLLVGLDNAQKVAADGDRLYVIDDLELVVVDISDPTAPAILGEVPTGGTPRDVEVLGDRVYVALGALGVDVFDVGEGDLPERVTTLVTDGSSQAIAGSPEGLLAVADWSHVSLYDSGSLQRLGTERNTPYPNFEQNLGVAMGRTHVFVAEWESVHVLEYRQGFVAPDIFVAQDLFAFPGDEASSRMVAVRNRGPLDLTVSRIVTTDDAWTVRPETMLVRAGGSQSFELSYTPPPPGTTVQSVALQSDDPDPLQAPLQIPLHAVDSAQIDVGDSILIEEFAFLDPTGAEDVQNLRGRVLVLAYFALF